MWNIFEFFQSYEHFTDTYTYTKTFKYTNVLVVWESFKN